jgi:hypothetical protein
VFGIFEILFGAVFALMVPLLIFAAFFSADLTAGPPMTHGIMSPNLLFYTAAAVFFIWMGLTRRWA